jgi:hypothetical protein
VVNFTTLPLNPQGKSPWYPLDRRLGGPQSRSGRGGEEKNSQPGGNHVIVKLVSMHEKRHTERILHDSMMFLVQLLYYLQGKGVDIKI